MNQSRFYMARLFLTLTLPLLLFFAAVIATARAQPAAMHSELHSFLTPADCQAPCIMGVEPGRTPIETARDRLRRHPWVTDLSSSSAGQYSSLFQLLWHWSGQQPDFIDTSAEGLALADTSGIVASIRIQTTLTYADIWQALGPPDAGNVIESRTYLLHALLYDTHGQVIVIDQAGCPVDLRGFWSQPVLLHFGYPFMPLMDDYADWAPRRRWCR